MSRYLRPLIAFVLITSILLVAVYPLVQKRNAHFVGTNTPSGMPIH